MKLCMLKEKITPDVPVLQIGFAARTHKSEGVHDDPYATVIRLAADGADAESTAVIVAFDLVGADESFAQGIRTALAERCGLSDRQIILSYSHTHAVVAATGENTDLRGSRVSIVSENFDDTGTDFSEDERYYRMVRDKVVEMAARCRREAFEGDLLFAKGESRFGVSRRYPAPDGQILWKPYDRDEARDPDLFVLQMVDRQGAVRGILYSYACHPTTMGSDNYLLSAEYPGVVRRLLEQRHPGATAMFLQGCGADIKPAKSGETGVFRSCSYAELEEAGAGLAAEIEALLSDGSRFRRLDGAVKIETDDIRLYTENWPRERWEDIAANDPAAYRRKSAKQALAKYDNGTIRNYLPYRMSCLRLDADVRILAMPHEVVSDIGKKIKRVWKPAAHRAADCGREVITLGYTNCAFCYIPTRLVSQQGGYEAQTFLAAGVTGPFLPEIEDIIVGHAALMLSEQE